MKVLKMSCLVEYERVRCASEWAWGSEIGRERRDDELTNHEPHFSYIPGRQMSEWSLEGSAGALGRGLCSETSVICTNDGRVRGPR